MTMPSTPHRHHHPAIVAGARHEAGTAQRATVVDKELEDEAEYSIDTGRCPCGTSNVTEPSPHCPGASALMLSSDGVVASCEALCNCDPSAITSVKLVVSGPLGSPPGPAQSCAVMTANTSPAEGVVNWSDGVTGCEYVSTDTLTAPDASGGKLIFVPRGVPLGGWVVEVVPGEDPPPLGNRPITRPV